MHIKYDFYDNRLLNILDVQQELEIITTGFEFIEGPIWHNKQQHLTFSDIAGNKIYRWHKKKGLSILVNNSNKANGNCYDLNGNIITCEHATSMVVRYNLEGGSREVLVSHNKDKELNSPNDVVVKSNGDIYFTDPRFGRNPSRVGVPRKQELSFQGVFCFNPNLKELKILADDFANPNGLCFSMDERLLYVNDSGKNHIRVFDVKEDGSIDNSRIWAHTIGDGPGVPDGMKIDSEGNLYCCAQGGLHFFDKNANYLGVLKMPEQTANFTWGDEDLCSIYLTATTTVYRIKTNIPGIKNYT